jgi:hypothetical protein
MTYCGTILGFFEDTDCGGLARPIAQAHFFPQEAGRGSRGRWLPDERRTCISAISGRDAFGCCETINILNKYMWYTGETPQPDPCD